MYYTTQYVGLLLVTTCRKFIFKSIYLICLYVCLHTYVTITTQERFINIKTHIVITCVIKYCV